MAIDTKLKRMSAACSRRLPWMRRFTPSPDGSVTQPDRQHVAFVYRGISSESTDDTAPDQIWLAGPRGGMTYHAEDQGVTFYAGARGGLTLNAEN